MAAAALGVRSLPAAAADVVAVVPFTAPNQVLDDATGILTTKLTERGITPKTPPPTDWLAVVANAAQICAQTGANEILVPTPRTEQAVRVKQCIVTSINYIATHARAAVLASAVRRHAGVDERHDRRRRTLRLERAVLRRGLARSGDRARARCVRCTPRGAPLRAPAAAAAMASAAPAGAKTAISTKDAIGEHLHHGANFRASVSSAIEDAFGHWARAA